MNKSENIKYYIEYVKVFSEKSYSWGELNTLAHKLNRKYETPDSFAAKFLELAGKNNINFQTANWHTDIAPIIRELLNV